MTSRPNILLLFTDQQRADTIGALGNPVIRTPNLDRLSRDGTAFTSAYTPAAECVPARCGMVFGQYPGRTRCYNNGSPMPWDAKETFMAALARAGYCTHGVGKCHFTPGSRAHELHGFHARETQEEIVAGPEADDYLRHLQAHGGAHITDPHGVRGDMYYVPQPAQMPATLHPTQWVGDRGVAFLEERGRLKQPWFLFASFVHPHPPFAPPAPWHKLYRDLDVPMPHIPIDSERLLVHVNRQQNRYKRRDRGFDLQLVRTLRAYYYACISFVDCQVGRLLATLEATGQLDNTLIVFASDHGELLGDYRCFGKRSFHDAAARIPLILRGPGVAADRRVDTPVSLLDLPSTFLNLAGTQFQSHAADGVDLLDVAAQPPADRLVFSQLNRGGQALYTAVNRRWKFVYSAPDQRELLFDRVQDPGETHDLADATWQPNWPTSQAQAAMRRTLVDWLRGQGEEPALDGDRLRRYPKPEWSDNPDAHLLYQDHPWANHHLPGYSGDRQA
jgi:arylsulfatase A-like enzyme